MELRAALWGRNVSIRGYEKRSFRKKKAFYGVQKAKSVLSGKAHWICAQEKILGEFEEFLPIGEWEQEKEESLVIGSQRISLS